MNSLTYKTQKSKHWLAFFVALGTAAVIFLPFVIYNRGFFIYIGDFNVQQIPFYKLAHEAVRSGDIFWNWYTDLGANFIGSYSFYLTFSPFFWLTLPFPTEALPYLMAPLLVLKTACAALTSYFYLQRFVRDKNYAVIGSLLYAFSGFTAYNIFFNHFHEVIVFFPLMLIGLEELLVNNRRGVFAITVAINAIVNYWFFVGEVVFVILYYFIRCTGLKGGIKKFFWVAFEAVLGVLCSMFALLPSVLAVMGNPRTALPENMLGGWQFWLYTHEQRQPGILASFFFPPETPSRPNMFPDHGAKWASLSAWLPLFSMSGVLAFLISARKNWLRKMIIACFVIAMVPGLNSLFVGFNHSYYTRWFYMLVLLLCAATVVALENAKIDIMRGYRWTAVVTGVILLAVGFTPVFKDGAVEKIGLANDMQLFWVYAAISVLALLLCYLLIAHARQNKNFTRTVIVVLALFSVSYTALYLGISKQDMAGDNYIIDNGIMGRRNLKMPDLDEQFYRMDIYDSGDNFGMYWHIPNIQAFHSVVPTSIMKFYPEVGVKRDVSSRPQPEYYALRSLFSVKYLFIGTDKEDQEPMPGYHLTSKQLGFNIYENENYLPMGFAFDGFITEDEFKEVPEADRHKILMRALVLNDEQAARYGTMLDHVVVSNDMPVDYTDFLDDVAARREGSCYFFQKDNRGFTARSNLDKPGLMFFSVPSDKGWSATVNGEPAQIETVDIGFMAVRVPAGECEIRFDYMTPGLLFGLAVTGGAVIVLLAYWLVARRVYPSRKRVQKYELFEPDFILDEQLEDQLSLDDCLDAPEAHTEPAEPQASDEVIAAEDVNWSEEDFIGEREQAAPQQVSKPKQNNKKKKHKK
ncbi:YfhO family protein [Hydrogenoanaerobacterium sp.]|uniref:YfhO family protein n=1 Tax=Hydrogenoanaerobacterium sp. TaxID=2953763 RepID=UPI0028A295DC|nr:YfhO family protein [Hydrogenoanaerobacterium sp.]